MKIVLDAGHGFATLGKQTPDGMKEYEFNRAVAHYARNLLSGYDNLEVLFTHSDEQDVPLKGRTDMANRLGADCFLSIHANAAGDGKWHEAEGIETFIHTSTPWDAHFLATAIQDQLIRLTGRKNRGVKTANFHVLRETTMTAILVECGFMTHKEESKLLQSESYRKQCATAIVQAVIQHYDLKKEMKASSKKLYKVQVGAFANKRGAEQLAAELQKLGFDTHIIQTP
ncbi:N-acetylmuramoyl-L-alanine amidase [Pradoshia eiseniae]|uniref:N-acetylmuramoyl-L-alanine amidase n=1 Tax=Pradoshia eiseniae TaxID=2064768 RepID=A0A2S7N2P6_9BACI|nr:N-acetylmuramoyl-L-alanine amidase [Pradoshia eiseniae]PQD96287.1 N-acetylmuramoyl-L-alanine amidase [Pradoshia eiseniae]